MRREEEYVGISDCDGCAGQEKERNTEVEVGGQHKDDVREKRLSGDEGQEPGCS